jgi:hypothetical protein
MGLKGYRLWAMGQLDSTCRAQPRPLGVDGAVAAVTHAELTDRNRPQTGARAVALQVVYLKGNF